VKAKVGGREKIDFGRDCRERRSEEVMAGGDAAESGAVGKVGRTRQEDRQRKLVTENKEGGKKVTFRLTESRVEKRESEKMKEEVREFIKEEVKVLKEDRKNYFEGIEELKVKVKECEEKIVKLEEKLENIEGWVKGDIEEGELSRREGSEQDEVRSVVSGRSRGSSRWTSMESIGRDSRLSCREVDRLKKWVNDKEREERRNNVIVRGVRIPKEIEKDKKEMREWAMSLIKEKIGVDCKVIGCRESGTVLVIKLENEEMKKNIMRNKYKLKGDRIFIENDVSWEERRVQERIVRWAKEQKEKGIEIKIGFGRVRIGNVWRKWAEIEKEENERSERDVEKEKGNKEDGKNFE